jgi:enterochelin esterase family protein
VPGTEGATPPFWSPEAIKAMQEMTTAFEDDMTKALIPFIDSTFRTIAERDDRAMAGLSMGGMLTFHVTLNHLHLFSYIGGFSGAAGPLVLGDRKRDPKTDLNGVFADPAAFKKKVRLPWVGGWPGGEEPERMRAGLQRLSPLM